MSDAWVVIMTDSPVDRAPEARVVELSPASEECEAASVAVGAAPRRRYALACLREYADAISLPDLADEVAVREYETVLPEIPPETVRDVYMNLYYTHVPVLEEAGLVRYQQELDLVVPTEVVCESVAGSGPCDE